MQVMTCVGVGILCLLIGVICGVAVAMFMIAKDRTVVRLREGEVIIPKPELEALIKSASTGKKREMLES